MPASVSQLSFSLLLLLSSPLFTAAQTCYYPNGSPAPELVPCQSDAKFSSCCPAAGANDLYPLDYPNCTPDGLCKAGNTNFLTRGACTDRSWNDPGCPGACKTANSTGLAGITDCGDSTGWLCCDADHDAGLCSCSPPSGRAFKLSGTTTPQFFAGGNNVSPPSQQSGSLSSFSNTNTSSLIPTPSVSVFTTIPSDSPTSTPMPSSSTPTPTPSTVPAPRTSTVFVMPSGGTTVVGSSSSGATLSIGAGTTMTAAVAQQTTNAAWSAHGRVDGAVFVGFVVGVVGWLV